VTPLVTILRGRFYKVTPSLLRQVVLVKNDSKSDIPGPIHLFPLNLDFRFSLENQSVTIMDNESVLKPGKTAKVILEFNSLTGSPPVYTARIIAAPQP
jgi:hypothetical protein